MPRHRTVLIDLLCLAMAAQHRSMTGKRRTRRHLPAKKRRLAANASQLSVAAANT